MSWVLGALFGALFSNISADRYDRKSVVIGNTVTMIVGAALQTFAPNIFIFALSRFFSGVASGSGSTISSLYFGEIGPPQQRTGFVVTFQCMGTFGLVAITAIHFAVTGSLTSWR
uniref:Major facilitator superfamily (MFS) profile domain-containing protein n=1 Tax=Globisporangium ultimum (strain ATCC 200006 / CBS 805.95 / DAOM BR144) TaxID=431595 RepID=K3W5K1_GLOUD